MGGNLLLIERRCCKLCKEKGKLVSLQSKVKLLYVLREMRVKSGKFFQNIVLCRTEISIYKQQAIRFQIGILSTSPISTGMERNCAHARAPDAWIRGLWGLKQTVQRGQILFFFFLYFLLPIIIFRCQKRAMLFLT